MKIKFNKKKIFLTSGLFLFSSSVLVTSIVLKKEILYKNPEEDMETEVKYITVFVEGAVKYPGEYNLKKGSNYLDLFKESILKSNADLSNIQKSKELENNEKIIIPYSKKFKFHISEITNYEILVGMGIKVNIAIKVLEYIKKGLIKEWKDVLQIPGVGEKTYLILEENINI